MESDESERSVIVLGAGLAGLTAALDLKEAGFEVTALEARDRVGGRVWTLREPFQNGQSADAGGEFIDSYHHDLLHYVQRFNLSLVPIRGQRRYYFGGRLFPADEFWEDPARFGLAPDVKADWVRAQSALLAAAERITHPEDPWTSLDPADDAVSLWDWVQELGVHPDLRSLLDLTVVGDYATDPDVLSAAHYLRDEAMLGRVSEGIDHARILGGTGRLAEAFAACLGDRIRLGTAAVAIRQDERGVTVRARRGSEALSFRARYLVSAIPATTLREIAVEPAWPPATGDAIHGLRYGEVTKVLLQFRERRWRDGAAQSFLATDGPVQYAWEPPQEHTADSGIISIYTAGQRSRAITALAPEDRVTLMTRELDYIWPGLCADLIGSATQAWVTDPWSRGAYSYYGPGEMLRFGPVWTRPCSRIYFAGEHTSAWQAFMTGAVESGRRVARQIIERAAV